VYDSLIEGGRGIPGELVEHGTPGELVATAAFPNMPVYFWNDPDGSRYFSAYFEKYDNVWTHGDFVQIHPTTKNLLFLGRADGVLNPSGVRFGSAEIYSVLEKGFPQIEESICVGQRRPQDEDERVMLFLMMREGEKFTQKLVDEVKAAIRKELSARHVPKFVFETPEIPVSVLLYSALLNELYESDYGTDNCQSQKGRITSKADCQWENHKAKWNTPEPEEFGFLLSVRESRGADCRNKE
jgi:acetoacetyl-CoA synthetase